MPKFEEGRWVDIPEYMRDNAKKALEWRKEYGRGLTDVGVQTAKYLAEGSFPIERLGRAKSYLARAIPNYGDKANETEEDGGPTEAKIALHAWGSDGEDDALERFSEAYAQHKEERSDALGAFRYDSASEKFEIQSKSKTPEGYLKIYGTAASRVPLIYTETDPGGPRVEIPSEEALSRSAKTLVGVPVTLSHPPVGLLTSENATEFSIGSVIDAHYDPKDKRVHVELRVIDEEAIREIESGKVPDLSPGYRVLKWREATPEEREETGADIIQLERSDNHLAVVKMGRGDAPLHLDSQETQNKNSEREDEMGAKKNEDMDKEQEDMLKEDEESEMYSDMSKEELAVKIAKMVAERDDAMKKLDEMKSKMDAMEAKMDAMKSMDMGGPDKKDSKHEDEMEEDREDSIRDPKAFAQAYREHNRALKAAELLGLSVSDEEPTMRIKARVVQKQVGDEVRVDSKSDSYIEVYFDTIMERMNTSNTPSALYEHVQARRLDSVNDALEGVQVLSRREQMKLYEN